MKPKTLMLLLLCPAFFLAGWWGKGIAAGERGSEEPPGKGRQPLSENQTLINNQLAETAFVSSVTGYFDSGDLNNAKHMLRMREDGNILLISELSENANERSRRTMTNLFAGIARRRANTTVGYQGSLPKPDTDAITKVASILKQFQ